MAAREGITRTGKEAKMCKLSASDGPKNDMVHGESIVMKKQTPLVNRVYEIRMKLMHKAVKSSCTVLRPLGGFQILILGAGQDSNYDVYGAQDTVVYLVDFPEVMKERRQSLKSSYVKAIGVDMTRVTELVSLLSSEGFNWAMPTIVVFECVLCYVAELHCSSLLSMLSFALCRSVVISYDPVLKSTEHEIHALSHHLREKFTSRGAPLLSSSHSVSHRINHFLHAHWKYVSCVNLNQAVNLWLSPEEQTTALQESFDEYTSLVAIHNRYVMTIASCDLELYKLILNELRHRDAIDDLSRQLQLNARIATSESQLEAIERLLSLVQSKARNTVCKFAVRAASALDSDFVKQLYQRVFEDISSKYVSVKKFIKSNLRALQDIDNSFPVSSGSILFVAEVEGEVKGCVGCRRRDANMELSHLSVSLDSQKKGIGRALVNRVIDHCRSLGINQLDLTVLSDLKAAIRLYESLGFCRKRIDDLGNGCILHYMSLQLKTTN